MDSKGGRRKSADDIYLAQKIEMLAIVRERFARFGEKASERILRAVMKPGGLQALLDRLGLPPDPSLERQFELVFRFLSEYGSNAFLNRLGASQQERGEPLLSSAETQVMGSPPIPPAPEAKPPRPKPTQAMFDDQGRYIGPERRKTKERRSRKDRRADVELILKNKRYGGERRQDVRRRDDRRRAGLPEETES